jgi:hypothetical protein
MISPIPEPAVLQRLIRWADGYPAIRAMLLYSSRANPSASLDRFSDML